VKGGLADVDADGRDLHEMILLASFAGRCYFTRRTISLGQCISGVGGGNKLRQEVVELSLRSTIRSTK
jgi:hypothetical protein